VGLNTLRAGGPEDVNVLHMGNGTEPASLDPHVVTGVPEHHILGALFEGLVNLDAKDLAPKPGVAESWTMSDDGLVYTFKLRQDARWSNGDPVTAHDFTYAWRRILTPSLASRYAYMLHCMKNAKAYNEGKLTDFSQVGAKALDDYTLKVTLESRTPYFLSLHIHYTWFPVHQKTIETHGTLDDLNNRWILPENFVGNGAFTLATWEPNKSILARKSPTYWNAEEVKLDGVRFYPVSDLQTEERMFRSGDLHFTENAPTTKIDFYKENRPEQLRIAPWLGSYYYRINTTRPPFDDPRVRRALSMAIDREAIVKYITRGGQIPARYYTPQGMHGYQPENFFEEDVPEARRLLAEAGYPEGKGMPPVDIHYNTAESHRQIAEAIQQMWKENLGIDVTITNEEWKVYLDTQNRIAYDVSRAGWIGDFADPVNFLECFTTGNGNNRTGYASEEFDALIAEARRTDSLEARNALYLRAETILLRDMPLIPIYIYTRVFLVSADVEGRYPNVLDHIAFDEISLN